MITLIGGGARSGKSLYAEQQISRLSAPNRIYIATMDPGDDPENLARIAKHRAQRLGRGFHTVECPVGLEKVEIPAGSAVLLECLTNLLSNEMFGPKGAKSGAVERILAGADALCERASDVFFITNDINRDGCLYTDEVEEYRGNLSAICRHIAARADEVIEMCAGLPVYWKKQLLQGTIHDDLEQF